MKAPANANKSNNIEGEEVLGRGLNKRFCCDQANAFASNRSQFTDIFLMFGRNKM